MTPQELKNSILQLAIQGKLVEDVYKRQTMDLDTTLKNLPLTPEAIRSALEQICAVPMDDNVAFEIGTISPIREDDIYGGYRVMLNARFDTLLTPLSIDVSTGCLLYTSSIRSTSGMYLSRNLTIWAVRSL